ncbi:MAG TPA: peptidoglycan-associated lipoprotein Pal [Vicinamibacterales bacterium]|jgi:peptidoglycan-associated lipoprotein
MIVLAAVVSLSLGACHKRVPPVARPVAPPPPDTVAMPTKPPAPPEPVKEPVVTPPTPIVENRVSSASLDEINKNSPLKPVFFDYDSAEISADGQKILDGNAEVLKKSTGWVITIEGHCDERGTAEYNLALGERRAVSARTYLVSLGIPADRIRTVSYGKEFPFDPAHNDAAWAKNRRDHFVVTQK